MKKIITETVNKTIYLCDTCNKEHKTQKCYGCQKDVCRSCAKVLDMDPFSQIDLGDYWSFICQSCDSILTPFAEKAKILYEQYDTEITKLEKEFQDCCKSNKD